MSAESAAAALAWALRFCTVVDALCTHRKELGSSHSKDQECGSFPGIILAVMHNMHDASEILYTVYLSGLYPGKGEAGVVDYIIFSWYCSYSIATSGRLSEQNLRVVHAVVKHQRVFVARPHQMSGGILRVVLRRSITYLVTPLILIMSLLHLATNNYGTWLY